MDQPELRRQRLVLFRQDSRRGRLVEAASPLAMLDGVRAAMPLSEAKSLLQRGINSKSLARDSNSATQRNAVGWSGPVGAVHPSADQRSSSGSGLSLSFEEKKQAEAFFIFEHDPAADLTGLEELANSLSHFSPIIGIEQIDAAEAKQGEQPSSILLDITRLDRLWGSETELARQLQEYVQELGYLPRLAIANTLGMAWGMSRFGASQVVGPSKISPSEANSSEASPSEASQSPSQSGNGSSCFILPADDQQTFLQLPVESLRLPPGMVATLKELGIKFNQQLWRLSRSDLAMRFGDQIHRRIDQATGQLAEPIIAQHQRTEFTATQSLEYPTQHRETIEVIIGRLVLQICQQLRARQHGGLQWLVNLSLVDSPPIQIRISMFQASSICAEVMPLIEMQMEQHWGGWSYQESRKGVSSESPKKKTQTESAREASRSSRKRNASSFQVHEIQVSVLSAVLLVPHQRQLFDENPRLDRQSLAQLINRLTSRLGAPQVVYPQLQSGAQPEYSYRFRPLVDVRSRRRLGARLIPQSHVVGRPLRIFNPPIAIEFVSQGKNLPAFNPSTLTSFQASASFFEISPLPAAGEGPGVRGKARTHHQRSTNNHHQPTTTINHTCGPERIETGWWRGMTVCRDYWRVETSDGRSLWIYRDLRSKQWFLQGEF